MTATQWLKLALVVSIMLTVFGLGLTSTLQDATFLFRRPKALLKTIVSMNVVMPIVAALVATTFALPFEIKAALVALAVSPVPPILHKKQITAGGREKYVVGLFVAMSLLAIVIVPLAVEIVDYVFGRQVEVSLAAVAKIMLMTALAPLPAGLLIRHFFPASEKASGPIVSMAGILLILGGVVLIYGLWPNIWVLVGNGVVLMLAVMAAIGLAVGHWLGGPRPEDRTTLALATSSRHPGVAFTIMSSGAVNDPKPQLAAILLYLVVATIVAIPYQKWRARAMAPAK